jgi:hypothetical protein
MSIQVLDLQNLKTQARIFTVLFLACMVSTVLAGYASKPQQLPKQEFAKKVASETAEEDNSEESQDSGNDVFEHHARGPGLGDPDSPLNRTLHSRPEYTSVGFGCTTPPPERV